MSVVKEINVDKLKIMVFDTRKSLGVEAAKQAAAKVRELSARKNEVNIIFAAAPSQNEFLEALLEEDVEWGKINAFHMDEYIGLDKAAPQGFGNFLRDRLFGKAGFKSVNYLNGNAADIEAECERYTKLLKANPTDIVCLGIGENGHLAFNDPPVADFNDKKFVKVVELEQKCRQQQVNDGCFSSIDKVPTHALTITIPAIMAGGSLYCMVPGKTKTQAVYDTATTAIGTHCPATAMRKHDSAVLFTDIDSAAKLL